MIFDDLPFKGYNEDEIINNIIKLKQNLMNKDASPYVKNLIKKILHKNPFKRISVTECLKHDWFSIKAGKNKKSNNNVSINNTSDNLKKFFVSHISGISGEFIKESKNEKEINTDIKSKKMKINKKEGNEKEKKINERNIFADSLCSESMREESSCIISDSEESQESKEESSDSNLSKSYSSFSPSRSKSNSIYVKSKNILSEMGKKNNNLKKNYKKKDKKNEKSPKKTQNEIENEDNKIISKDNNDTIKENNIDDNNNNNNNESIPAAITEKKIEQLNKINKNEVIKHISLTNKKFLMSNSNNSYFRKSFSLSMLDVSSDKSNAQKLSPLLIDTMKYMKFQIQINYSKNKEEEKIEKLFNKIINNKNKLNITNNTVTYNDLYLGYSNYIGQKRFCFDTYSDNKKIFVDLSKYINEEKKNGNIINTLYEKEDFIRILIIFKEKYLEYRLQKSYQKLKKSNVNEIFNCLNEIEQKAEFNYYKKYFNEIKNIMMKNKYKEIYLFYEFKNLIINSVKNVFIKEKEKQKKEKEKQKSKNEKEKHKSKNEKEKEKQNKKRKTNSYENSKSNGIKGIIRVVSKERNFMNHNNVFHIDSYDHNRSNLHTFNNNRLSNDSL